MQQQHKKPGKVIEKDKAATAPPRAVVRHAALRGPTTYSDKSVQVDEAEGVIRNIALMTVGPALGHPFTIDQTTIDQLVALANASADGVKSRFRHPGIQEATNADGESVQMVSDDTGTMIGRIRNARVVGGQARGDLYIGQYAAELPGMGDVRKYLLLHAKEDPAGIGMSAFFSFHVEPQQDEFGNVVACPARLEQLDAIDIVGCPAANPRGLLSAAPGWQDPAPKDPEKAPIPAGTPEFPNDVRGGYLAAIVKHGPMSLGGIAARFNGRLEAMRAGLEWLTHHQFVSHIPAHGRVPMSYKATPKGVTAVAKCGLWK